MLLKNQRSGKIDRGICSRAWVRAPASVVTAGLGVGFLAGDRGGVVVPAVVRDFAAVSVDDGRRLHRSCEVTGGPQLPFVSYDRSEEFVRSAAWRSQRANCRFETHMATWLMFRAMRQGKIGGSSSASRSDDRASAVAVGKRTLVEQAQPGAPGTMVRVKPSPDPEPGLRRAFDERPGGGELPFREELERSFGVSLEGVRAHTAQDPMLDGAGARAAARGDDVLLGAAATKHEVAHEVAHVLQHRQAGAAGSGVAGEHDDAEADAEQAASAAAAGKPARVAVVPSAAIHLMRVKVTATGGVLSAGAEYEVVERLPDGVLVRVPGDDDRHYLPAGAYEVIPDDDGRGRSTGKRKQRDERKTDTRRKDGERERPGKDEEEEKEKAGEEQEEEEEEEEEKAGEEKEDHTAAAGQEAPDVRDDDAEGEKAMPAWGEKRIRRLSPEGEAAESAAEPARRDAPPTETDDAAADLLDRILRDDLPAYAEKLGVEMPPPDALRRFLECIIHGDQGPDQAFEDFFVNVFIPLSGEPEQFASGVKRGHARRFADPQVSEFFATLFHAVAAAANAQTARREQSIKLHPHDLFHAHMAPYVSALSDDGQQRQDLVMVFHAKEYPTELRDRAKHVVRTPWGETPSASKRKSGDEGDLSTGDAEHRLRNFIYLVMAQRLVALDPRNGAPIARLDLETFQTRGLIDDNAGAMTLKEDQINSRKAQNVDINYFPEEQDRPDPDRVFAAPTRSEGFSAIGFLRTAGDEGQLQALIDEFSTDELRDALTALDDSASYAGVSGAEVRRRVAARLEQRTAGRSIARPTTSQPAPPQPSTAAVAARDYLAELGFAIEIGDVAGLLERYDNNVERVLNHLLDSSNVS